MIQDSDLKLKLDKKEEFHNRHELFTERAYNTPGLLPDRYVFVLTNLCNLNCSFCMQKKRVPAYRMTATDWISLAGELPDYARVTLTGGEPLLLPGFKKIFSYVAPRFDYNVISNGILLDEEKIDFLLSHRRFKVLSISIDNIGNTLRSFKADDWRHLEKIMRLFARKKSGLNPECVLEAKTVILDENAEELFQIYKYCVEELCCDHHTFQFLKGSPIQHADYMVEYEDILKKSHAWKYSKFQIIKEQLELVRRYNIKHNRRSFLHPLVCSLFSEEPLPDIDYLNEKEHIRENYLACKFPWSSVHINSDGELFPCLAITMGNVKTESLEQIIFGKSFQKFKDLIRQEGTIQACNRCGWLRCREG